MVHTTVAAHVHVLSVKTLLHRLRCESQKYLACEISYFALCPTSTLHICRCRVKCGFAALRSISKGEHDDRMDSFFLAGKHISRFCSYVVLIMASFRPPVLPLKSPVFPFLFLVFPSTSHHSTAVALLVYLALA